MGMDILTVGLAVCDILVKPVTPELFQRDSTRVNMEFSPGGDACNVAMNAAALGLHTGIVTVLGEDGNGKFLLDYLQNQGVDTSAVCKTGSHSTGTSIVMVEPNGERHFLSNTEIFEELGPDQIPESLLKQTKILSLNSCYRLPKLDDGGIVPVFARARDLGILTAMDTTWNRSGDWLGRIRKALEYTDIFLPSYQEAVQITGEKDVRAMSRVMSHYGLKIFGVKMGEQGSYVTDFNQEYQVPPFSVKNIVNTVGAGDSYVAGFLAAQVKDMGLRDSAVFASAVAAFTVQTMGAVGGVPTFKEVQEFINRA